jgi:hypothetical protein
MPINEKSTEKDIPAILGENTASGNGVDGRSKGGNGVIGSSSADGHWSLR